MGVNIKKLIIAYLAAIPLISTPTNYEGLKVLWFLIGGLFIFLYSLSKHKLSSVNKSEKLFIAWVFLLLTSSLLGLHPTDSILGNSYRHQGVIFFLLFWMIFLQLRELFNDKDLQLLKKILVGIAVAQVVIAIIQIALNINLINGRPVGTIGEPNALAGFLVLVNIFLVYSKDNNSKLFCGILFLGVILTQSMTGIFSFLIVYPIYFISKLRLKRLRKLSFILLPFIPLLLLIVLIIFQPTFFFQGKFENRPLLWKLALEAIEKRPILGYGAESTQAIYELSFIKKEMPLYGLNIDRSHNIFLDIALWSGLVGLGIFSAWIIGMYKKFVTEDKYRQLTALIVFITFAFFQPLGVTHWIMLGILVLIPRRSSRVTS